MHALLPNLKAPFEMNLALLEIWYKYENDSFSLVWYIIC